MKTYFLNVLIGFDIFVNTLFAGKVRTISERIGEIKHKGKLKRFPIEWAIDTFILEPLDPGHSLRVYENNK